MVIDITQRINDRRLQAKAAHMVEKIGTDGPSVAESFGAVVRDSVPVRTVINEMSCFLGGMHGHPRLRLLES